MFAGVGPIAVVAAKKVKFVYANDLNPAATAYMQQNLSMNKLAYKAEVWMSSPEVHYVLVLVLVDTKVKRVLLSSIPSSQGW